MVNTAERSSPSLDNIVDGAKQTMHKATNIFVFNSWWVLQNFDDAHFQGYIKVDLWSPTHFKNLTNPQLQKQPRKLACLFEIQSSSCYVYLYITPPWPLLFWPGRELSLRRCRDRSCRCQSSLSWSAVVDCTCRFEMAGSTSPVDERGMFSKYIIYPYFVWSSLSWMDGTIC